MKQKFYLNIFLALVFVGFLSCNNGSDDIDDGPCGTAWSVQAQNEVSAWSAAAQKYALDPSAANCNAYKSAGLAYIKALEPYGNCTVLSGVERTQWEQALESARTSIKSLNCN
jgi:hypothetical protein